MPIRPGKSESEQDFIGRCMSEESSSFPDESQRYAVCKSMYDREKMSKISDYKDKVMAKVAYEQKYKGINLQDLEDACWPGWTAVGLKPMGDRMVPNCVPDPEGKLSAVKLQDGEINIFGYNTKNFKLCPGATTLFAHLITMELDDDVVGMTRSAAQVADNVFGIEKDVLESETATQQQLDEAKILVSDFKDIIEEIDEETGMIHDTSFMDRHIQVIESYIK